VARLGLAAVFAAVATGPLVRLVFHQRQHRALVAWLNGVAAIAALVVCTVKFDLLLASLAGYLLTWELAVAVEQLMKPKVDNAR
jgi:hypothetical protein